MSRQSRRWILFVVLALSIISLRATPSLSASPTPSPTPLKYLAPTFYLSAEPGCYLVTPSPTYAVAAEAYKRMFRVPCTAKHHLEVFFNSKIDDPTHEGQAFCLKESAHLIISKRNSKMYNWSNDELIMFNDYFPDAGIETSRFAGTVVCVVAVSNPGFRTLKQVDQPIIKGMK